MPGSARIVLLPVILTLLATMGCHPVNTIPPPALPSDPIKHYDLDIPVELEVRSVTFDATAFSDVSGGATGTSTEMGGRAFLKVYAVHRRTGEQYLLVYEDIEHRKAPVQVIRFRTVADSGVLTPAAP